MDSFITIRVPGGRDYRIDGSERELAGLLKEINDSFELRGGVWLVWSDDGTSWVPATSDIEFSWDVTQIVTDFPAVSPTTIEVIPSRG